MDNDPDRPLVARAVAGDRDAFGELVRRYQSRIYNLVVTLGVSRSDADDVAQDVFLRVYRGIARFRGEASFRTWLYQVTLNTVRSHLSARSAGALTQAAGTDDDRVVEPAMDDPFARRLADRQVIDRALASLPDDWREAVTLRDVEGLSYREIAELTGAPLGTVESRIFRARQQLRVALVERQDRP